MHTTGEVSFFLFSKELELGRSRLVCVYMHYYIVRKGGESHAAVVASCLEDLTSTHMVFKLASVRLLLSP
jgi:hypothetical protein